MIGKPLWSRNKPGFGDTEPMSTLPMLHPGDEAAYAETAPQPLARMLPAPIDRFTAPRGAAHDLMAEIRKDNRVCPQPQRWAEFYELLSDLNEGAQMPSPPLVGKAWTSTPALAKRMCFCEQVEWAIVNDRVIAAHAFLKCLREQDWHYMG
jgi:hypothetical protein